MRILILTSKPVFPSHDGYAVAVVNMLLPMKQKGVDLEILSIATHKHPFDQSAIPAEYSDISFNAVDVDTSISPFNALYALLRNTSYNLERFYSSTFNKKLIELLRQNDFDLVQLEGLFVCPYIDTIRQHSSANISLRAHNVEHQIWERMAKNAAFPKSSYLNILARQLKKAEYDAIGKVDALISMQDLDHNTLTKKHTPEAELVLPISLEDKNVKRSDQEAIFFIGSMDWLPNQEGMKWFLDEVLPMIVEKHPGLKFHIAGSNQDHFPIQESETIKLHGRVSDAKEFMGTHGIMMVPLLSGSGMRVKIIEAMMAGCPIVSTSIGAEGIKVNNGQDIMISDAPGQFAENVLQLLEDKELRSKLARNARELALAQYEANTNAEKLINFYQESVIK